MNKNIKKLLCAAVSLAMAAGTIVLPITAANAEITPIFDGDTVEKEWKFDFGAEGATPEEGFTLVTPDMSFVDNKVGDDQYGFLGIGEEDYKLTNRYDGWTTQKGQKIELKAGGGTGASDAIGVVGAGGTGENVGKDIYGNQADIYYPTRFALKVEDETYYRVRATVTTLDPEKAATVSLYTERKHPIYTEKTIEAGQTYTETFSVRVTPIYYEKSTPTGAIKDEMLTVGVLGENSALVSVEIQKVGSFPTVWVLGDSTVTDGNTTLPFFPLQNYTGVGTGLTKYLRRDYTVVNEGEGGLNAYDSNHFNMVTSRIKAGDYMYVEYGHNHKDDGPTGYLSCLDKYYNICHEKGAKLIIVSPVQSDNSWNTTTKRWDDRFGGETNFAGVGKKYVADKVAAGATDIAFADLTKTSVEFVNKVTVDGGEVKEAAQFYYQTNKGGGTDPSHPNDAGAENFAYCFFEAAKENDDATQKAVLADLLANMTEEEPNLVSDEIVAGGLGGSAWPNYVVPTDEKYPVVINDVSFNEDGTVKQVDVTTRDATTPFTTYGIIVITVYKEDGTEKGKFYAVDQVDHSTGKGPQKITSFRGEPTDLVLAEGDTYEAVVLEADDSNGGLKVVENGTVYSAVYKPTDIAEQLILNEDEDGNEDFDYFGVEYDGTASLSGNNSWRQIGSATITSLLKDQSGVKYVELTSTGKKPDGGSGSFYYDKSLAHEIGTTGRYLISADMQFVSGGGMTFNLTNGHDSKNLGGVESLHLFDVSANGDITSGDVKAGTISAVSFTNVQAILDMDLGTLEITVAGNDPVTVQLDNYKTSSTAVTPSKLNQFMFGATKEAAFDVKVSSLTVATLKPKALPQCTLTVASNNDEWGTAEIKQEEEAAEAVKTSTADINTITTVTATPKQGYVFLNWTDGGTVVSSDAEYTFRLRKTYTLTANFVAEPGVADVASYDLTADKTRMKAEAGTVNINIANAADANNTPISKVTNADAEWSCDDNAITVANGVVTIPEGYTSDVPKKTVTVTAKLNNVTKTIPLILYSAKYYEDFSTVENVADWITDTSTNSLSAVIDTATDNTFPGMTALGNGKAIVLGNNSNGDGKKLEYTRDMELSSYSVLTFGFEIEPNQIRSDSKTAAATLQFVDSEGTPVFTISVNTSNAGGGNSSFNGTAVNGFTFGTTVAVDTELDFTTKKMKYTLTDGSGKQLAAGEADLTAANLDRMYFSGDWNYGKFAIDNIYADDKIVPPAPTESPTPAPTDKPDVTPAPTDKPDATPTPGGSTTEVPNIKVTEQAAIKIVDDKQVVAVKVKNEDDKASPIALMIASYDDNGNFTGLVMSSTQSIDANGEIELTAPVPAEGDYKAMLWNGISGLYPIMDVVDKKQLEVQ